MRRYLRVYNRVNGLENLGSYYLRAAADLWKHPPREQMVRVWRKLCRIVRRPLKATASALAARNSCSQHAA